MKSFFQQDVFRKYLLFVSFFIYFFLKIVLKIITKLTLNSGFVINSSNSHVQTTRTQLYSVLHSLSECSSHCRDSLQYGTKHLTWKFCGWGGTRQPESYCIQVQVASPLETHDLAPIHR